MTTPARPLSAFPHQRPRSRVRRTVLTRLRRRPVLWWLATLALAMGTAQVVAGSVSRAEEGAARYGATRTVLVATRDVGVGEVLEASAAEMRDVPAGFVPRGAAGAEALGGRVTERLHTGEVVHGERVAPGGLSVVAALLPPGTRGIAVPTSPEALSLEVGDVVDVLATIVEVAAGTGLPPTVLVVAGAIVVDVREAAVSVAVPVEDAARVAYALSSGIVTLTLVPG